MKDGGVNEEFVAPDNDAAGVPPNHWYVGFPRPPVYATLIATGMVPPTQMVCVVNG